MDPACQMTSHLAVSFVSGVFGKKMHQQCLYAALWSEVPNFVQILWDPFSFKKWKMIQLVKIHTLVVEIGERFLVIKSRKHLIIFGQKLEVPAIVAVYRLLLDWWDVGIDFILDRPSTSKVLLITYTIKSYPFQIFLPFKIW